MGLLSLNPEKLDDETKDQFKKLGITFHSSV